jgi:serine/threonine-protein kinase
MRECPRCERCYEDEALLCLEDQSKTKHTLPGTTLLNRRYRLEKRLGRGAMGQVYLARDQNLLVRRVAVKTIRPDVLTDEDLQEGEAIARFEREARTAASVQHPNVIDVTDFGKSDEGVFFLVMEFVEGESLYQLLRREGTLSVQRALALLRQISRTGASGTTRRCRLAYRIQECDRALFIRIGTATRDIHPAFFALRNSAMARSRLDCRPK